MPKPLENVKVVEMGTTVAGPAVTAVMADWGATVVKVEPAGGETLRSTLSAQAGKTMDGAYLASPMFYTFNRGKHSVVLDLKSAEGKKAMDALLGTADVFVSNMRQQALEGVGMGATQLHARFPRLVVCAVTGYGKTGPDANTAGYDLGAYYARSGIAHCFTPTHPKYGDLTVSPPILPAGVGDVTTAMGALAGVNAALLARERTGKGQIVWTSLMRAGVWANAWTLSSQLAYGKLVGSRARTAPFNPLINLYRTKDRRYFFLLGLESQRHFPATARAIERPDLLTNPLYSTPKGRNKNTVALVEVLDAVFATRTLAEWAEAFAKHGVWWQPINTPAEVVRDPQLIADGGIVTIAKGEVDKSDIISVNSPVDFSSDTEPTAKKGPVPTPGAHNHLLSKL
eukprot:Sspe_Gene.104362::Locus_80492_Transcript_1_1_Confidence_1.000_Length_1365::g.104362::m.104362